MDLSLFRESLEKQRDGAPIYVGDSTFYVKRLGTPESQKIIREIRRRLFSPFHKAQDGDENLVFAEWLSEYGVTDWENVTDGDGEIKYSKPVARNIFTNPEYYQSLNLVLINAATNFENYLHEQAEEDLEELKKK